MGFGKILKSFYFKKGFKFYLSDLNEFYLILKIQKKF